MDIMDMMDSNISEIDFINFIDILSLRKDPIPQWWLQMPEHGSTIPMYQYRQYLIFWVFHGTLAGGSMTESANLVKMAGELPVPVDITSESNGWEINAPNIFKLDNYW